MRRGIGQGVTSVGEISCHVDELVDVIIISLHVLVLDEPFDLFLDQLLGRQKHVLQDFHELRLECGIADHLPHL